MNGRKKQERKKIKILKEKFKNKNRPLFSKAEDLCTAGWGSACKLIDLGSVLLADNESEGFMLPGRLGLTPPGRSPEPGG